jgi:hypothetical protein
MPSLDASIERHVVIDRRPGHYICFPDVCRTADGSLLCAYNEFDRHVGTRRRLLLKESRDDGRTWGETRILRAEDSHCPRLSVLPGGLICLTDDAGPVILWSEDNGRTFAQQSGGGLGHGLIDRALPLGGQSLFTAGHLHRGSQSLAKIRQAPAEQMAYISRNLGRNWEASSVIANGKNLVLCEASAILLPGPGPGGAPRLLALMRENSFVGEPMYFCASEDGVNWSEPAPTPFIGHRPTLAWTRSGRLLVTYRDVGPNAGTKAWLGGLDELCSDFAVHGLHPAPGIPAQTAEGLLVKSAEGEAEAVRYCLRPLTDPAHAKADFRCEVMVRHADEDGCGIRLGIWWRLYPDCIVPDATAQDGRAGSVRLTPGRFHTIRIVHEPGLCRLYVDGRARGAYPVDPLDGDTRPILVGAVSRKSRNSCEALWRRMSLSTVEPRLGRSYDWRWEHTQGAPDAWTDARVLELRNDRRASFADFGYSGWAETRDGEFFCAYHHAGGGEPGYKPGETSHVAGTWFTENDFGAAE